MVLEDGSGLTNSNSYVSVLEADTYFNTVGNLDWVGTDAVKDAALVYATEYVDLMYKFVGELKVVGQALQFPRIYDTVSLGIPLNLKKAVMILALKQIAGTNLYPEPEAVKRKQVDVLETEYFYPIVRNTLKQIDKLLEGLAVVKGSGAQGFVELL